MGSEGGTHTQTHRDRETKREVVREKGEIHTQMHIEIVRDGNTKAGRASE